MKLPQFLKQEKIVLKELVKQGVTLRGSHGTGDEYGPAAFASHGGQFAEAYADGDGRCDFFDYAVMANDWLKVVSPWP